MVSVDSTQYVHHDSQSTVCIRAPGLWDADRQGNFHGLQGCLAGATWGTLTTVKFTKYGKYKDTPLRTALFCRVPYGGGVAGRARGRRVAPGGCHVFLCFIYVFPRGQLRSPGGLGDLFVVLEYRILRAAMLGYYTRRGAKTTLFQGGTQLPCTSFKIDLLLTGTNRRTIRQSGKLMSSISIISSKTYAKRSTNSMIRRLTGIRRKLMNTTYATIRVNRLLNISRNMTNKRFRNEDDRNGVPFFVNVGTFCDIIRGVIRADEIMDETPTADTNPACFYR